MGSSSRWRSSLVAGLAFAAVALPSMAQVAFQPGRTYTEGYRPTIWVDPDGCQHWVMDTGFEGFLTQRLGRDGKPVCREVMGCGSVQNELLFSPGSAIIATGMRDRLRDFFIAESAKGTTFVVRGYADATGTAAANSALADSRAEAIAQIARSIGADVSVAAPGNDTAADRQQGRRVEIVCQ
jgi:outer membrane protein OmpA-like peptidoglycan-associated protein